MGTPGLEIQLLGGVTVRRDGNAAELPASRKVRALLAYLALAPRPVGRGQLCELLWDVANDPRGELRWCLSKLRGLLDDPGRARVTRSGDSIGLALDDCVVDVLDVANAVQCGIETLDTPRLRALLGRFGGEFLEGIDIDRQPQFNSWLIAQRRRFRACHTAVLEHLVRGASADATGVLDDLAQWLQLAPLDVSAHTALLNALARHGRIHEGEEHLAATTKVFEDEGLDVAPLRFAWAGIRNRRTFDAASTVTADPGARSSVLAQSTARPRRASIAVMPFADRTTGGDTRGGLAEGLVHDVITRLAKLRAMFVIAQGSVFALNERNVGPEEAGRMLNVDYVASGAVQRRGERIVVTSELVETRFARILWTDTFDYSARDALLALDDIGNNIVASIAHEIEVAERNRAVLLPPTSLDAWEAYHRGLWHMYRFNAADNDRAGHFLELAIRLDPTFARAYAGLSFTHFQNAFLHRIPDRESEINRAFETASQSVIVDEQDPAAHWAMGRALWLRGRHDESLIELARTVELSPNFALGHYTLSFVHCQSGDPRAAIASSDHSRHLSPFDPLLFAMLASRALAHLRLGEPEVAAEWALKAVARPNAHAHILAIAAHCLVAADRVAEARDLAGRIAKANPRYRFDEFLTAFQFSPDAAALLRQSAKRLGIG